MNDKILTFNSIFAPSIDEYLAVKQQQNTNVRAIITVMKELDKLPLVRHIELPVITKEIFMQWKSSMLMGKAGQHMQKSASFVDSPNSSAKLDMHPSFLLCVSVCHPRMFPEYTQKRRFQTYSGS